MKPWLVALALGLALTSAGDAMAETGGGIKPCIIEHQFEPGPIVNGIGEHAIPFLDRLGPPFLVAVNENFGIRLRLERVPFGLKFNA